MERALEEAEHHLNKALDELERAVAALDVEGMDGDSESERESPVRD